MAEELRNRPSEPLPSPEEAAGAAPPSPEKAAKAQTPAPPEMPPEMPEAPPEASAPEELSPKKKRALLEYMGIMFAVAFLLVAVSLLVKLDSMRDDLDAANTGASVNIYALEQELESAAAENAALSENLESVRRSARAAELLALAQSAYSAGDNVSFHGYMAELEGYSDALSAVSQTLYQSLARLLSENQLR